jgi:hypothetical protein
VLFEDAFDKSKLGEGWSWVYEDKPNWKMDNGKLQIHATGGSSFMAEHNGKNYLLRTPPPLTEGEVSFELYVENKPAAQWEHAGLYWFFDDDHYVILNKESVHGKPTLLFMIERDGKPVTSFPDIAYESEGVWMRFRVTGTRITGEYRATPNDKWTTLGSGELPVKGEGKVGLHAGYTPKTELDRWASFSHFKISKITKE